MVQGAAASRLAEERKSWRKDHPYGFVAKPRTNPDGSTNILIWDCKLPGKEGTIWEGGLYPLTLHFNQEYPTKPPAAHFPKRFVHPNVFESGDVCLSISNAEKGWKPSISIKQILLGIQELLHSPNENDPANWQANDLYNMSKKDYEKAVKQQAKQYTRKE